MRDLIGAWIVFGFISGCVGLYVDWRCRPWTTGREGFWHGFLFGPIGWILLALYPRDAQSNSNPK